MATRSPSFRTLWLTRDGAIHIIDQTLLPHTLREVCLKTPGQAAKAIITMQVRGAPLIGVTAAYGVVLAMRRDPSDGNLAAALDLLVHTRPTAVNLHWALEDMRRLLEPLPPARRLAAATARAAAILREEKRLTEEIGRHGLAILRDLLRRKKNDAPLQIMTHCNAGKLATSGLGTATAPMYLARAARLPIHVWVSETRPRIQGALTAWELGRDKIPHTIIADNSAGHLMQHGLVDIVIVGADRVTSRGDAANKIGTYMKALAAKAHGIPFYVAIPGNTIDWSIRDGVREIPIEQRDAAEVTRLAGKRVMPEGSDARNDAFDVTPASLVTGFITERGVCGPRELKKLFAGARA